VRRLLPTAIILRLIVYTKEKLKLPVDKRQEKKEKIPNHKTGDIPNSA
jgi:hypothetical protein